MVNSNKEEMKETVRSLRSEEIFQGQREVSIVHGEYKYRLQITKAGKLILTK